MVDNIDDIDTLEIIYLYLKKEIIKNSPIQIGLI